MAGWLRTKVFNVAARVLTKPRGRYTLLLPNDFESLLRVLKPGDVILVDGDQRVSEVIKYLTQSTWSHSVLYVGAEIVRRVPGQRRARLREHRRPAPPHADAERGAVRPAPPRRPPPPTPPAPLLGALPAAAARH